MAKKWFRLDTAALIFPVIMKNDWSNVFRISVTVNEDVDPEVLRQALRDLKPRFPSFFVRLCRGFFWYYLEQCEGVPEVTQDYAYPLSHMGRRELSRCCLRVFYFRGRIAVEFFHALSDGNGGSIFVRSLAARYLELKYGTRFTPDQGTLSVKDPVLPEELEDSFFKNSALKAMSRREENVYHLHGTRERSSVRHLITGIANSSVLLEKAHEYNCTVTVFLAAVMASCILDRQAEERPLKRRKPVKITVPVNLRKLYGSRTLRNFVLTLNAGVDPRYGDVSLQELCDSIRHQIGAEATPQRMAGRIAANVQPQQVFLMRVCPRVIKNIVMEIIYGLFGERKGCINVSNLGVVRMPEEPEARLNRMDFIIGVQRSYPNNCSVVSFKGRTFINMIRNIRETDLERRFFSRLVELGVPIDIETNGR